MKATCQGVLRTKSIEQSIQDTEETDHKLRKELSAWDLTVFGIGVIIGTGIFVLTGIVAATKAGPAELIAWIIGWDLVLEFALGAAAVSVGWASYFSSGVPHPRVDLRRRPGQPDRRGDRAHPHRGGDHRGQAQLPL
jgi:amino acid transporter